MITTIAGQTLLDVAIKNSGSAFALFDYAVENGLSLNEELVPGQKLNEISKTEFEPDLFDLIFEDYKETKNQVIVSAGQNLLDVAIHQTGSVFSFFEMALKNGVSLNDELVPGQKIEVFQTVYSNVDFVNFFKSKGLRIATGYPNLKDLHLYELPGEFPYSF